MRYATDRALREAERLTGGWSGSVRILTTIRPDLQRRAQRVLRTVLERDGDARNAHQGAAVVMLSDGAIEAYVGGRDWRRSQFDRVFQARRQPGSAMKPFLYAAAFEAGFAPEDVLPDAPIRVGDWEPRNFDDRYRGPVTLHDAFVHSLNGVAVRLILAVKPEAVVAMAHRLGLREPLRPLPSLALGAQEVRLLDLVAAYAPFENGGLPVKPYLVLEVRAENGPVLYRYRPQEQGAPVLSRALRQTMRRLLQGVVRDGTARRAALAGVAAAGKTGTTQDFRDAVFVGFIPGHLAGVWVGNDDNSPMKGVTGGSLPATIWREIMTALVPAATRPEEAPAR